MALLQTPRSRAAALVAVLGIAIALALTPFASGLLGAAVLYVICAPAHRRLSRVLPPRVAAAVVLTVALVLVLLPLAVVVGIMVNEAPNTLRMLQSGAVLDRLSSVRIGPVDLGTQLASAGGTAVAWVTENALAFAGGAARSLLSLVIAFFGLYFLLLHPQKIWLSVRDFLPFSDHAAETLRDRFHNVTVASLVGIALTSAIQGTLVGVGFALAGLPSAAFWGVITAIVAVLPMFGSALVWVPGVAVLIVGEEWGGAVLLSTLGLIGANADNVVRLIVFKRISDIHPMATLIGAFAGLKYVGLLGVLLGPLAIAYFFELLKIYRQEYVTGSASAAVLGDGNDATRALPSPSGETA
jgi:predicted PurR-regulated permease PerM